MNRDGTLGALFGTLLFGVIGPAGCIRDGACSSPYRRMVDADVLAVALADDELAVEECELLCTNSTRPRAWMATGTDGGSETGPDSGTATGMNTGTETTATSEATSDTGAETGDATMNETVAESSDDSNGDESGWYNQSLHKCTSIAGSVDQLNCWIVDCAYGRRPAGLRPCVMRSSPGLARLFVGAAYLEAASVPAFERLAAALAEHGAPAELRARALAAAEDERRHAQRMAELAEAYGGEPVAPEVEDGVMPDLRALALDNAIEGCVGETWAALVAGHQAHCAEDPAVRATMSMIAADETRHAELAWAIDAWLTTRLSDAARVEVNAARDRAVEGLRARVAAAEDDAACIAAGIPRRVTALALIDGLDRALWREAA